MVSRPFYLYKGILLTGKPVFIFRRGRGCKIWFIICFWHHTMLLLATVVKPHTNVTGISWWCHQMETFSALLAICAGNSPVTGGFPAQRPMTPSFDVLSHQGLDKRLSKQWWGWWFETPSHPLWRQCNVSIKTGLDFATPVQGILRMKMYISVKSVHTWVT